MNKPGNHIISENKNTTATFTEIISPFIKEKLEGLKAAFGENSPEYQGLARQYVRSEEEDIVHNDERSRHYDAETTFQGESGEIHGLERLYRRTLVIEPTFACAAHCRYCLRANYPRHSLSEDELLEVARYCGNKDNRDALNEVLITGGDPLTIPKRIGFLVDSLRQHAPNIKIMRIATRLPQHSPSRVSNDVFRIFRKKDDIRFELATQINHPVELSFPETVDVFKRFRELGVPIYAQNVLLRGVNDDVSTLIELYDKMRELDIEPHYLFHCIPLMGMNHMRTTIQEGLDLSQKLLTSGYISGRGKPMFAAMTDIGKIIFYEGTILERKENKVLLQSHYRYEERKAWNPSWVLPDASEIDENGLIRVWYSDGADKI